MKSHTDLEQSKKLAQILPIETADMWWNFYTVTYAIGHLVEMKLEEPVLCNFNWFNREDNIPAWSLGALLDFLKKDYYVRLEHDGVAWCITCIHHDNREKHILVIYDNRIDACVEMIIKLKEKGLI